MTDPDRSTRGREQGTLKLVRLMSLAMDAGDPFRHGRSYRCSQYARRLGREFLFDDYGLFDLEYAALLQDVGDRVVLQRALEEPAPVEEEPNQGVFPSQVCARLLDEIPLLEGVATILRTLNERFDGSGRSASLAGSGIPLASRILSVVSAFDALTSDRPHRAGLATEEAFAELRGEAGRRFDPEVVERLIALHESRALFEDFDPKNAALFLTDGHPLPEFETRRGSRTAA